MALVGTAVLAGLRTYGIAPWLRQHDGMAPLLRYVRKPTYVVSRPRPELLESRACTYVRAYVALFS